jgi:hypothetical protein
MIYNKTLKTLVEGSLKGINGTLFMYGQTGSGKTYTMMGDYSEEVMSGGTKRNRTPIRCSTNSATPRLYERAKTPMQKMKNSVIVNSNQTRIIEEKPINEGVLIHSLKDLFSQIQKVIIKQSIRIRMEQENTLLDVHTLKYTMMLSMIY